MNSNSNTPFDSDKESLEQMDCDHSELINLFDELRSFTFGETNLLKTDEKWTELLGKPLSHLRNYRLPSHNFQLTKVFPEPDNPLKFAAREKIHLYRGSLGFLKDKISQRGYQCAERIFSVFGVRSNEIAKSRFYLDENQIFQQILLIRYSQEPLKLDFPLQKMGSEYFGEVHEDETLFSIHLGESSKQLQIFNYEDCQWEYADFNKNGEIILWGQQARHFDATPSPHRLYPVAGAEQQRFSFIVENILLAEKEAFLETRFDYSSLNEFESGNPVVLVSNKNFHGEIYEKYEISRFKSALESAAREVFPETKIRIKSFDEFKDWSNSDNQRSLLIFDPKFDISYVTTVKNLFNKFDENTKKLVVYQQPWSGKQGVWLINLSKLPLGRLKEDLENLTLERIQKSWPNYGLDK